MEKSLCPENLKGLNLSYVESIYVIAFGLEDEVRVRGKEAIFQELNMTEEEMSKHLEDYSTKVLGDVWTYALRRVLGDLDSPANDEASLSYYGSLDKVFKDATASLRAEACRNERIPKPNCRFYLTKGRNLHLQGYDKKSAVEKTDAKIEADVELLYVQVQQLMDEVRAYDEKRERALARIEELMREIMQRKDCPEHFRKEQKGPDTNVHSSPDIIDMDGPISQIRFHYRSLAVLRSLGLNTIGEVVQYFADFANFAKGGEITFMEWSVITAILRKAGLLPAGEIVCDLNTEIRGALLSLSVRAYDNLVRGGISDVDGFATVFANGASEGWGKLRGVRGLGKKSIEEIVTGLGELNIELDDSLCFPTTESHVRALDFDREARVKLKVFEIKTIGELLAACENTNRFYGLKYIDENLYSCAMQRLKCYGFIS